MKYFFIFLGVVFLLGGLLFATLTGRDKELLDQDSQLIRSRSLAIAKLYVLPPGEIFKDITEEVCVHPDTSEADRKRLMKYKRCVILFEYPSDGLKVKGILSFTPKAKYQPLLVFLRGGNRLFGLMHPSTDYMTYKNYTAIMTTYRDGVSPGKDEFGGTDVNDVKNLIDFIPTLEKELKTKLYSGRIFMIGESRGGLEMFLALARYPELQAKVEKAVSLSSVLDLHEWIQERPDMKDSFEEYFGMNPRNEETWIERRDPLLAAAKIQTCLPFLILQGTGDQRVSLREGYHMAKRLRENNSPVTYLEIPGGDHTLSNVPNRMDLIIGWLELHGEQKQE